LTLGAGEDQVLQELTTRRQLDTARSSIWRVQLDLVLAVVPAGSVVSAKVKRPERNIRHGTPASPYHEPVTRPVTLSQVAREAGVSIATASRAFNGSANRTVREDLRERVAAAAERLRYFPDANAQAMVRGRTTSLGLIVHDIADPYFSSIAAGVTIAAERADLAVTLASTQHDPSREPRFVEVLTRQRALAIVIAGGRDAARRSRRPRFGRAAWRAPSALDSGVSRVP